METIFMRPVNRAFTIVELLVVIGIVALLAAILIVAVNRAKESGRQNLCLNNLRQISLAMQQYISDNDSRYPADMYVLPNRRGFGWQNAIYPYAKNSAVFHCPTHNIVYPPDPRIHLFDDMTVVDYRYNIERLNIWAPKQTEVFTGRTETALANPSLIFVFVDDTNDDQHREVTNDSCGRDIFGVVLHNGGGNYAFMDGHVRWLTPEGIAEIECRSNPIDPFRK